MTKQLRPIDTDPKAARPVPAAPVKDEATRALEQMYEYY